MDTKDKELLLKDLCARLPYGVKVKFGSNPIEELTNINLKTFIFNGFGAMPIPYLRPMSSMTEEEKQWYWDLCYQDQDDIWGKCRFDRIVDFCLKRHLDYRGLIEKGLALEAPEGMYN